MVSLRLASNVDAKSAGGKAAGAGTPPAEAAILAWRQLLAFRNSAASLAGAQISDDWRALFGPFLDRKPGVSFVVGQLGQSLDGRIATDSGHSRSINGAPGLLHLHRLRALVDAVLVGIGTVLTDDPRLTVRLCEGQNPARVVIDPGGRLPRTAKLLENDGNRCIVVTTSAGKANNPAADGPAHVEHLILEQKSGRFDPHQLVAALRGIGLGHLLIEGGADTVSGFVAAGALDRLHILTAPVIIGSGKAGLRLPCIAMIDEAMRPRTRAHLIGNEVIFDCDFGSQPIESC
jgi:diaminohydroxyphosphoribosylaminopyrimidine deaminase/5-amino-6-(5-phosphoribosylamino)uracil reductase